jgi:hypothetical protein
MTIEWMKLITTFHFSFCISKVEVSKEHIFHSNKKYGREGGDFCGSIIILLILNKKTDFLPHVCC